MENYLVGKKAGSKDLKLVDRMVALLVEEWGKMLVVDLVETMGVLLVALMVHLTVLLLVVT